MPLLNIEPLSINTHTQTSPALPYSSLRPQPHPPCLLLPVGKHCWSRRRKEERKKGTTYIQGEREARESRDAKRKSEEKKESSCSEREMREAGVKWEETVDRLSDKCVRCMFQFTATPPPSIPPVYEHCFGSLPKDIPFFSLPVPRIYRHEAAELLLLHHNSPSCLQIKLFLFSRAQEWCENERERDRETEGGYLLKSTQTLHLSCLLFVKLTPSTKTAFHQGDSQLGCNGPAASSWWFNSTNTKNMKSVSNYLNIRT